MIPSPAWLTGGRRAAPGLPPWSQQRGRGRGKSPHAGLRHGTGMGRASGDSKHPALKTPCPKIPGSALGGAAWHSWVRLEKPPHPCSKPTRDTQPQPGSGGGADPLRATRGNRGTRLAQVASPSVTVSPARGEASSVATTGHGAIGLRFSDLELCAQQLCFPLQTLFFYFFKGRTLHSVGAAFQVDRAALLKFFRMCPLPAALNTLFFVFLLS